MTTVNIERHTESYGLRFVADLTPGRVTPSSPLECPHVAALVHTLPDLHGQPRYDVLVTVANPSNGRHKAINQFRYRDIEDRHVAEVRAQAAILQLARVWEAGTQGDVRDA